MIEGEKRTLTSSPLTKRHKTERDQVSNFGSRVCEMEEKNGRLEEEIKWLKDDLELYLDKIQKLEVEKARLRDEVCALSRSLRRGLLVVLRDQRAEKFRGFVKLRLKNYKISEFPKTVAEEVSVALRTRCSRGGPHAKVMTIIVVHILFRRRQVSSVDSERLH